MSGTVHLMFVHIGPPFIQSGECIEGIDVAIWLLGGSEFINPFVRLLLQLGIRIVDQAISHTF